MVKTHLRGIFLRLSFKQAYAQAVTSILLRFSSINKGWKR